ncbi:DUF4783 domain-containing protein [Fibrella aquatilis]|nr:DUF4783 domain-containing protein [Fibrella aquatilis]
MLHVTTNLFLPIQRPIRRFLLAIMLLITLPSLTLDNDINVLIISSVKAGKAAPLATYFDKQIELKIDALQVDYTTVSARQAELILGTFFRKYPPYRFEYIYKGGSGNLLYRTGSYYTGEDHYQVYVLMHRRADKRVVIHSLQFRKA